MSQNSSNGSAWRATRLRILDRDNWTCQYCSAQLEGDDATVDHIVSKETWKREGRPGNPDDDSNLIAACRPCNSSKQDRDELPRINYLNPRWIY